MAGGIVGGIIGAVLPGVLPSITETAKILVDRLVPDPVARAQAQKEIEAALTAREAALMAAVQAQNEQQSAVNLAEAQSGNWFASSWRPAAAWVCVFGLAYQYAFAPLITWFGAILGVALGFTFPAPPTLVMSDLWPILAGLLGLGTLRTVERTQGVSSPSPAAHNPAIPRR